MFRRLAKDFHLSLVVCAAREGVYSNKQMQIDEHSKKSRLDLVLDAEHTVFRIGDVAEAGALRALEIFLHARAVPAGKVR